jgi:hypothetical protein
MKRTLKKLLNLLNEKPKEILPGETELDYIPLSEIMEHKKKIIKPIQKKINEIRKNRN